MIVKELIELLKTYPEDAEIRKLDLKDDSGYSSDMKTIDWSLVEELEDEEGNSVDEKIVCVTFGEDYEEEITFEN